MNRRDFLWVASGVGLAVAAGPTIVDPPGYRVDPIAKTVFARDPSTSPPFRIDFLERRFDDPDRGPYYRHSDRSPLDRPADDEPLIVDEETHDWIAENYTDPTYLVELCGVGVDQPREYGCLEPAVSREDFNSFILSDRLHVTIDDDALRADVLRVYEGAREPAGTDTE